jgi:hypothetical protein
VIVAHVTGVPVEESFFQLALLAPTGAATATAVWLTGRTSLRRLRRRRPAEQRLRTVRPDHMQPENDTRGRPR